MAEVANLDPAVLDQLRELGGDSFLGEMIRAFLEHTPERLNEARRGAQANDLATIARATHSLKSSAGSLGASALRDLAARLEQAAAAGEATTALSLMDGLPGMVEQAVERLREVQQGLSH